MCSATAASIEESSALESTNASTGTTSGPHSGPTLTWGGGNEQDQDALLRALTGSGNLSIDAPLVAN